MRRSGANEPGLSATLTKNSLVLYCNAGQRDTYIPAACPALPSAKSGPGCCGWFYSCIGNTTRMFAALHGFAKPTLPLPLAAPLAGSAASCRGFSKAGSSVATALVADCSWAGPHGWPREAGAPAPATRSQGSRWPAEMIVDFFLQGRAPPPPPPAPRPLCPDCGGHTCDGWIASNPQKYTCAELERDWGCNCHGCKACPNATGTAAPPRAGGAAGAAGAASITVASLTTVFSKHECSPAGRCWFCFRIPAVKVLPSGHLLAFAEARNNSGCADNKNISLVVRRSVDKGLHWGPIREVASYVGDGGTGYNTSANPDRRVGP